MAARMLSLLAGLALVSGIHAQAMDPGGAVPKLTLSNLYVEGAYTTVSYVCARRFADEAPRWNGSLAAWKARHAAVLAEFRDLDAQLSAAVKAAPQATSLSQEELMALRTQPALLMLGSLAEARDSKARDLCDNLLSRMDNDDAQAQASTEQARSAARELLKQFRAGR